MHFALLQEKRFLTDMKKEIFRLGYENPYP
jgi:hypothetical protein